MAVALASRSVDPSDVPAWIGCYRLLDRIAEGGMGCVFRALDTASGRMVALKTPRTGTAAEIVALRREAATLGRLSHRGIVRLLADGSSNGMPWVAMELLAGRTLTDEIASLWKGEAGGRSRTETGRPDSDERPTVRVRLVPSPARDGAAARQQRPRAAAGNLGRIASIVVQLGMALDHVHDRGLVHRDVKPANVLLGPGACVTLLDFGLACRANGPGPARGEEVFCVGTMSYAAPEQIRGEPTDARTDVYSLGCVLYELVTGLRPFGGASTNEVAQKQLHQEALPPSRLVSELPWQLEDLLREMLAKQPRDRPASAGAAVRRLGMLVESDEAASGGTGFEDEPLAELLGVTAGCLRSPQRTRRCHSSA